MTNTPKPRKKSQPLQPSQPISRDNSTVNNTDKPYQFVSFPQDKPNLKHPVGHDKFDQNLLHGTLFLTLKVQTAIHVSTGITFLGSDLSARVPLIKTMVQGVDNHLIIQGSSLKGCIRSVYEAITRSCICKTKADSRKLPEEYQKSCSVNVKKTGNKVCDACRIFGALNLQGLLEFNDSLCKNIGFNTGFMQSLHIPQPIIKDKDTKEKFLNRYYFDSRGRYKGRKFYYQTIRASDNVESKGIHIQQAAKEYSFTTKLQFKNLKPEELGTLCVILGQDANYPLALKIGGGKPIGMGTMTVEITQAKILQKFEDLRSHYCSYTPKNDSIMSGETLKKFIQTQIKTAHSQLIQPTQLQQLTEILRYPTNREPKEGMY